MRQVFLMESNIYMDYGVIFSDSQCKFSGQTFGLYLSRVKTIS